MIRVGGYLIRVDRYFPSSKMCSDCSHINDDLTLSQRTGYCDSCGTELDRDLNASINILNESISLVRQELPELKLVEKLNTTSVKQEITKKRDSSC